MYRSSFYFAWALLIASGLAACGGGSRQGCALYIPKGPVPAGTPIPLQPLPANAGISTSATANIAFAIDANGAVTSERVLSSSGNAVVDNAALQIVKATTFKPVDTNCEGAPVRQGNVAITFTLNP